MFNKNCLTDGMVVENRDGRRAVVFRNKILYQDSGFDYLDGYTYNLVVNESSDVLRCLDIVKVYIPNGSVYSLEKFFNDNSLDLVWEAEELKEDKTEEDNKEEDVKPKKVWNFNETELDILKEMYDVYNWLARDKDGSLGGSIRKPTKNDFFWDETDTEYLEFLSPLFKDILWEDEEPVYINDYIKTED